MIPDEQTQAPAPAPALSEILYCSELAPDLPPDTVASIVARARVRNGELGITGLLVFDGQRFCQHIEGPPGALQTLMTASRAMRATSTCAWPGRANWPRAATAASGSGWPRARGPT